jgi:DNA/RNA endonuclease G (NUC1)
LSLLSSLTSPSLARAQVGEGFNRDYWAHTEDFCRRLTKAFGDVYVFTIPLYLPRQDMDGKWRVSYECVCAALERGKKGPEADAVRTS